MPTNFLNIPPELRNQIYEIVLLHDDPIRLQDRDSEQELTLGLFRTNKVISREASSLFYSKNCFDITACVAAADMGLFPQKVGRNNAGYIQHILIDFPDFQNLDAGNITLKDDSIAICTNMKSNCTNLSTITTSVYSMKAVAWKFQRLSNPKVFIDALEVIDARFRSIPSLKQIIVEMFKDDLSDYFQKKMKDLGWTIVEYVEDEDRSLGDFEEDYGYDFNYYGDNDFYDNDKNSDPYDIDNDSDFWRRAAD